ncbi:MAG: type VI secretion system tube protein Hcp [Chthoniobacter sp.]
MPGDPDKKDGPGWFPITNFHFALTGVRKDDAGDKKKDEGLFEGVEITMPTQYGSIVLMKTCTDFAIKKPDDVVKIDKAYIYVRRPGYALQYDTAEGSGQNWFLAYYLYGVTIASYATGMQCEDTFKLNYEKMQVEYWVTDPVQGIFTGTSVFKEWLNKADDDGGGQKSGR